MNKPEGTPEAIHDETFLVLFAVSFNINKSLAGMNTTEITSIPKLDVRKITNRKTQEI